MKNIAAARILLLAAALAAGMEPASSAGAAAETPAGEAAFHRVPELEAGYRFLYEQRFSEARKAFNEWSEKNPGHPFGEVSTAAAYLFEEFYHQGVMTSDYFLDDEKFLKGITGHPDAERLRAFRGALKRARAMAGRLLDKNPRDPEALFAMTLAAGMESNALSILEKKNIEGLRGLKEANNYAERLLAVRPGAADAWLALGSANYVIGCLPKTVRFFLWFGGYHGDRALGMQQLEKTASGGMYLQPYAKILLALAALREGKEEVARRQLQELIRDYPQSPLFAAEYARVMARPGSGLSR
ncbi:MAG: tetratricopeptide repeat protein [Candidatus Polarisedimenticolia bacterium]